MISIMAMGGVVFGIAAFHAGAKQCILPLWLKSVVGNCPATGNSAMAVNSALV